MNQLPIVLFFLAVASSAFAEAVPTTETPQSGFSLILKHNIVSSNLTKFHIHKKLVQVSKHRLQNYPNGHLPTTAGAPISHALSAYFFVSIHIGTPPLSVNLALDTGSSPTWVQSAHCRLCFQVSQPNFNPKISSTYRKMPRSHPLCADPYAKPSGNYCLFGIEYIDGESTEGDYGFDTFTFKSGDHGGNGRVMSVPNVAFGSGVFNRNFTFEKDASNPISGVLGVGKDDPSSFLHQFSSLTRLKFSYRLPTSFGGQGVLRFGTQAQLRGPHVQTTPLLGSPDDSYYLKLEAVSVNGTLLPIDPKLFMTDGDGVAIDSGTPYSVFVKEAYDIIEQAVMHYFWHKYGVHPLHRTRSGFDLCYHMSHHTLYTKVPSMVLHFQGANLKLHRSTTFQAFPQVNEYCMMMFPIPEIGVPNIFGAFQQMKHKFLFDVGASKLKFAPERC